MKTLLVLIFVALFAFANNASAQDIDIVPSTAAVAATSTVILTAPTFQPRLLYIQNDSDTVIYCNLQGGTAVVNTGARLNANGGSVWFDAPGTVPKTAITCIHGGAGDKTVLIGVGQ